MMCFVGSISQQPGWGMGAVLVSVWLETVCEGSNWVPPGANQLNPSVHIVMGL